MGVLAQHDHLIHKAPSQADIDNVSSPDFVRRSEVGSRSMIRVTLMYMSEGQVLVLPSIVLTHLSAFERDVKRLS